MADIKTCEYDADIIPLSWIMDKWLLVAPEVHKKLAEPGQDDGPFFALYSTLKTLKALYNFNNANWHQIRDTVHIGLIKDTKEYGNTSVSMGAAKNLQLPRVGILNCGTGGIKYQMYAIKDGILKLEQEVKPRNGCSFNNLRIGQYNPGEKSVSPLWMKILLQKELELAPWSEVDDAEIPLYALVTGNIRHHWETADANEKKFLELEIGQIFDSLDLGINPLSVSFFLSQEEEGRLEFIGTETMYDNLVTAGKLHATKVVTTFGIGQGSSQWVTKTHFDFEVVGYDFGMTNVENLLKFDSHLMSTFKTNTNVFARFCARVIISNRPVIALKSGCLLLFQIHEEWKKKFLLPVTSLPEARRYIVSELETTKPVMLVWSNANCVSRLCNDIETQLQLVKPCDALYDESGNEIIDIVQLQFQEFICIQKGLSMQDFISGSTSTDAVSIYIQTKEQMPNQELPEFPTLERDTIQEICYSITSLTDDIRLLTERVQYHEEYEQFLHIVHFHNQWFPI